MTRLVVVAAVLAALGAPTPAQAQIEKRTVHFKPGASSATVTVTIKGNQTIDYLLGAKQGQHMTVALETKNPSAYFNVLEPGSADVAFFIGSSEGNRFEGDLPKDGEYTVRLYLMRSAARRGASAACTLTFTITAK